ncbi:precorrin-6A synthase (deacetylating) [Embleya scabrispora]|uniref:Precorrin-6A synthase (Deacetylating) n=1 Tax=Embleya scabrispora TaxID=159449 RepID=A0A1T3P902_9ACTN|nr:precorrin-6A synthase (deacetylating) [Embleya scabrispora]
MRRDRPRRPGGTGRPAARIPQGRVRGTDRVRTRPSRQQPYAGAEVDFDFEVIPGISSVSALAARHRIALTQVGRPLHITPGRYFAEGFADFANGSGDIVVMLDAHQTFTHLAGENLWIYWGAYVGTPDEILVSGRLSEVADRIVGLRAEARARHGWIMDTYLLRLRGEG